MVKTNSPNEFERLMNERHQEKFPAVKSLLKLAPGLKETLFDGSMREFELSLFYVGKTYDIEIGDFQSFEKVGEATYVAVIKNQDEFFYICMDYELIRPEVEQMLELELRLEHLKGKFISDLGPLIKLYDKVEVPRAFIQQ